MTLRSGPVLKPQPSSSALAPVPRRRIRDGGTLPLSLRYGIAVAAIIWSTASLLLVPLIGRSGAAIPFFAVLISTWFGGRAGRVHNRDRRRHLRDSPAESLRRFPAVADPSDRTFRRGRGDDHGTGRGAARSAAAGRSERAVALAGCRASAMP